MVKKSKLAAPTALIVAPTRELVMQIHTVAVRFGKSLGAFNALALVLLLHGLTTKMDASCRGCSPF